MRKPQKVIGSGMVVLLSLVAVAIPSASAQRAFGRSKEAGPVVGARSFGSLFTLVKEVQVRRDTVAVGGIDKLRVGPRGQLLLLDTRLREAFLARADGQIMTRLTVEALVPGVEWCPLAATFAPDGSVVVWSASRHIVLFDSLGNPKTTLDAKQLGEVRDLVVDEDGRIVAYSLFPGRFAVVKIDHQGKVWATGGTFPKEFGNYLLRLEEGGCLALDRDGYVYQTNVCGPQVYKHSKELRVVEVFRRRPAFFEGLAPEADELFADPGKFFDMQRAMRSVTQNIHLFALNDTLFLSQYLVMREGKFALDIWSNRGRYYPSERLRYDRPILAARDNHVYTVVQPLPEASGNLPNPCIIQYRLCFRQEEVPSSRKGRDPSALGDHDHGAIFRSTTSPGGSRRSVRAAPERERPGAGTTALLFEAAREAPSRCGSRRRG
ncbi:MAG: hypothetical protein QHJ34_14055 [bacterium]|jgi:hypothetical protein|nr:hypothetical protein [candidate division KSB1 bacterium]MDH7561334.1 hypothetical protein [bacterium]